MNRAILTSLLQLKTLILVSCLGITVFATRNAVAEVKYVHAGKLVDVEKGRVLDHQLIRIVDGRIASIQPYKNQPSDGPMVDWSRYMVLPGLIDVHTHLVGADQSSNIAEPLLTSAADDVLLGAKHARDTLLAGFTTVRDVGTWRAFTDVSLRNAIDAGYVPGPRMVVVGAYLTIPGGGGEVTGLAPDVGIPAEMRRGIVRNAGEMRLKVRDMIQHGADWIKLIGTGAVLTVGTEPGIQEFGEEKIRAAVEEAAKYGNHVAVHAHGAEGIKAAVRAGVRSIEHGSLIDDEGIALMKAHGTWLAADIYNGDFIDEVGKRDGWPAETLRKNRETTDAQRQGFQKAVKAGVHIAFATDAGVFPHGQNARQFAYMVRYGMTPMAAIQAATVNAALMLDRQQDVGAISIGRYADMIAVEGDVVADISLLTDVKAVIKGGILVKDNR